MSSRGANALLLGAHSVGESFVAQLMVEFKPLQIGTTTRGCSFLVSFAVIRYGPTAQRHVQARTTEL